MADVCPLTEANGSWVWPWDRASTFPARMMSSVMTQDVSICEYMQVKEQTSGNERRSRHK